MDPAHKRDQSLPGSLSDTRLAHLNGATRERGLQLPNSDTFFFSCYFPSSLVPSGSSWSSCQMSEISEQLSASPARAAAALRVWLDESPGTSGCVRAGKDTVGGSRPCAGAGAGSPRRLPDG